jgi:hypothetical protein
MGNDRGFAGVGRRFRSLERRPSRGCGSESAGGGRRWRAAQPTRAAARPTSADHAIKVGAGTVAVDMDPLSLLCRLATSVPPPRLHTVRYAGVLAGGSRWRSRITPAAPEAPVTEGEPDRSGPAGTYRPWAELLARTFAEPRTAVLEEPSASPAGAGRRGRLRHPGGGADEVA